MHQALHFASHFFEFVESHLRCSGNVDSTINIQFTRDQIHFKRPRPAPARHLGRKFSVFNLIV